MLRVGLTGELGSGKSTVARMLAARGAVVLSSDDMARAMMQPGQPVYDAIVHTFGPGIVLPDSTLDRKALAALAFDPQHPRVEELNAIIHPAVIAEQERRIAEIAREQPKAIVIVESALIFTTKYAGGAEPWRHRFDRIILVSAPDEVKIQRFIERIAAGRALTGDERDRLRADAQQRLAAQRIPADLDPLCLVIRNNGDLVALEARTGEVFQALRSYADHVQQRATM
jgi:dephospho-CoA kinase